MRFVSTEERYLLVIHISVVIASVLLGVLIVTDVRLNTLGEVFGEHLMAISIAISRVVYGTEGLAGLEQVLEILRQIPNASLISLDSITSYQSYQLTINEVLQRATLLHDIDSGRVHAFTNDVAYLYFVIAAFSWFGIKIQSLSYLWFALLLLSILSFLNAYRKNFPGLIYLWCLLVSIILVVTCNPGAGSQLQMLANQRFIPVLGLVPLLHIILSIDDQPRTYVSWLMLVIQMLLLVFVLHARSISQWMLIAMAFFVIYSIWRTRDKFLPATNSSEANSRALAIALRIRIPVLVVAVFLVAKGTIPFMLHGEYQKSAWAQSHIFWYATVIGLTTDPVLKSKYVCSDEPLTDRLTGFAPMSCDKEPRRYPRLVYGILNQPHDMDAYQAAVRYLTKQGSGEQLGTEARPGYFNVRWVRLEEIMRTTFFEMLWNNSLDLSYMYMIVKPLKYLKEAATYVTYFGKSILGAQSTVLFLGGLAILFAVHVHLLRRFCRAWRQMRAGLRHDVEISSRIFFLILVASIVPSILFYSQSHTIAESVTILLALGCFFTLRG